jgi:hypothetical protein
MANKKVSQLVSKPSVLVTDLFPIADPTTGQLYKTTISDLGTAIGSGVSSVNTLVGAVVLDTDDIQELASPTNRWFTDTRARAAVSASSPLAYNSGTGVFSIPAATSSQNGYLTSTDWTTFNAKQTALSGTGFVKISGTTISYDNSTYLTTSAAASTYLALAGGTLTGALNGTSANFSGDLTLTGTNPRFYLTDSDNNPDYFISNTDGTFTVYDVTNSTSRFTIGTTGNGTFGGNLTVGQIIRSGGTSSQFLKADGSVDSTAYVSGSGATGYYARFTGSRVISDGFIQTTSNITYVEGMGLSTLNGLDITGNYGSGGGGLKIRSYDETTGNAYIDFTNTGGRFYLGVNRSTASGLMTNATAYATVLTTGLGSTNLEFGTNATKRLTIDGTTGAATFTSTISAAGATLTGALSGTSATFSGSVHVGGSSPVLRLDVSGNASDTTTVGGATVEQVTIFRPSNGTGGIRTGFNTTSGDAYIWSSNSGSSLLLGVRSAPNNNVALTLASTGAATFSSSVGVGGAPTGTYGALSVFGGLSIKNDNNAKLEIGRYSSGASNSYIKLGANSDSLRITNNTDLADLFTITNGGNVGIGTTAPSYMLDVVKAGVNTIRINNTGNNADAYLQVQNTGGNALFGINETGPYIYTGTALALQLYTNNAERMRITSDGNLLLGTTTNAGEKLRVNGNLRALSLYSSSAGLSADNWTQLGHDDNVGFINVNRIVNSGDLHFRFDGTSRANINRSTGAYTATSDSRLKTNISDSQSVLSLINKIKVRSYKWIENDINEAYGLIAQELYEILPEYVYKPKIESENWGLSKAELVPMLVKAIQELKAELDTLKNK